MTVPGPEVRVRPPVWVSAWVVVFVAAWLWFWLTFDGSGEAGLVRWLGIAAGLALAARMLVMGAVGSADGRLTVRNQFSTRTFTREELVDAVVDRANGPRGFGWSVWLVLSDGSRHPVQMTQAPVRHGFERFLERDAAKLRGWIRRETSPYRAD